MKEMMTKKDAIAYLSIPEKDFKNYFESSKEKAIVVYSNFHFSLFNA